MLLLSSNVEHASAALRAREIGSSPRCRKRQKTLKTLNIC
jgi:hypothetical protein